MGTAMGTPMAPNYANLFMAVYEEDLINSYYASTGLRPFVWVRYIDDIFMIWTDGNEKLDHFLSFAQKFSDSKKMKSKIKFQINKSQAEVNFLDVIIKIKNGSLETSLFSKPTDAHLYLNYSSNHPKHVLKNIPKGQFIRVRRICSDIVDYDAYANIMKKQFQLRGYDEKDSIQNNRIRQETDQRRVAGRKGEGN